jgi:hypothetical protein|tara:strand:+ start:6093 stop:6740 length:648 start_codon:yes stop_codon:yes gene_type:complete
MAIRILPFRQYDDHDVVNLYALESGAVNSTLATIGGGDAGVFVKVSNGNFNNDPVTYTANSYLGDTSFPFLGAGGQYPEVNLKVTGAGSGEIPLGITLFQTAESDENSEKLLYNPQKALENEAILPGQAVPIAAKGVFTLSSGVIGGNLLTSQMAPGSGIRMHNTEVGRITGCNPRDTDCFGTILGTGSRTSLGPTTDQFVVSGTGAYLVVKIDC